jgi:hypothetical protein
VEFIGVTVAFEYLCFAACIQTAVRELVGREVDQVWIANQLGISVSPTLDTSDLTARGVTNIRRDSSPHNWGISPTGLPEALELAGVKLTCDFHPISHYQDWEFEDRLVALCDGRRFPIVGFDYNTLFGDFVAGDQGHCAVVYRYWKEGARITFEMHDPGPARPGPIRVDSDRLYRACRRKPGGVWVMRATE